MPSHARQTATEQSPAFFHSGEDSLRYVIDMPDAPGNDLLPAFVLVHGSGEQNRYWNRNISDWLVQRGFIALRYDKRGTGDSSGKLPDVDVKSSNEDIPLLASDLVAAVAQLKSHPRVDPDRIGLAGVSQAGWIVPRAVTLSGEVDWTLLFVGPTVSVGMESAYSKAASKRKKKSVEELSSDLDGFDGRTGFDPIQDLEQQTVPGLWLFGAEDRSIPTPQSVRILDRLIEDGHKPFSYRVYPDVGHCLHGCGAPVWPDIERWLREINVLR